MTHSPTKSTAAAGSSELPLVVQLGFAGSRRLFDVAEHPHLDAEAFHADVERHLAERIKQLHGELGLSPCHFFCGISQIAIGADLVFTRACGRADPPIPQRIFLPQLSEDYLRAAADDTPDFTPAERDDVRRRLASPHIIQQRVVSDSSDRNERFEDVNIEIARVSDVLLCLVRAHANGKRGGTQDLIDQATTRGKPVLVIRVAVKDGRPEFSESWISKNKAPHEGRPRDFVAPTVPEILTIGQFAALAGPVWPSLHAYCTVLKEAADPWAVQRQTFFKRAAAVILGTHIAATILAVLALILHHQHHPAVEGLLGAELALLAIGFVVHQMLHRSHAARQWALARLVAEVVRSATAVGGLRMYLEYLFVLPLPDSLRPLLRTISVLHLADARRSAETWEATRDRYLAKRVDDQIEYYQKQAEKAVRYLRLARRAFLACSATAFAATSVKLAMTLVHSLEEMTPHLTADALGGAAIVLPVLAVAALSFAAALDLEARENTYEEMLHFLRRHRELFTRAASARELGRLVMEAESRLLGETANWFARRSFTGVA